MSHFCVLVIGDNIEEQLAPYQENNMGDCPKEYLKWKDCVNDKWFDTKEEALKSNGGDKEEIYQENPNAKWDWYVIGGRWSGFFPLAKDGVGLLGKQGLFDKGPRPKGKADQALKSNIDFKKLIDEARERATNRYLITKKLFGGVIPKIQKWSEYTEQVGKLYKNYDEARTAFHSQLGCKKLEKIRNERATLNLSKEESEHLTWLELGDYQYMFEEYVDRAAKSAASTFAVVKDGQWYQRGEMGWWGTVHDEKDSAKWNEEYQKLLDSVSDETLLTVVDCHI